MKTSGFIMNLSSGVFIPVRFVTILRRIGTKISMLLTNLSHIEINVASFIMTTDIFMTKLYSFVMMRSVFGSNLPALWREPSDLF